MGLKQGEGGGFGRARIGFSDFDEAVERARDEVFVVVNGKGADVRFEIQAFGMARQRDGQRRDRCDISANHSAWLGRPD